MKKKGKLPSLNKGIIIITGIFAIVVFPIGLAFLVFDDRVLSCIPGGQSDWFSFWATHLGSCVSIFVALSAYAQANIHKKEKEQMEKDQKRLIYLLLDVNFEIIGVNIKFPHINDNSSGNVWFVEATDEEIINPQIVQFEIEFLNKSFSLINNMDIGEIEIKIGGNYLLFKKYNQKCDNLKMIENRGDHTYLVVNCKVDRNGNYFKYISAFYLYKYRFFSEYGKCNMLLKNVKVEPLERENSQNTFNIDIRMSTGKNVGENFVIENYEYSPNNV